MRQGDLFASGRGGSPTALGWLQKPGQINIWSLNWRNQVVPVENSAGDPLHGLPWPLNKAFCDQTGISS